MAKRLRLKKLINWTVQGPIVMRLMVHFLSYNVATVFLLLVVYGIRGSLAVVSDQTLDLSPATFWQQAAPVVICMLVMMPFMIWDLMALTNRIAGPLYRFESLLKEYGKTGTLPVVVLREGDLLTDYQKQFNDFVQSLHARFPETRPASTVQAVDTPTVAFRRTV